MSGPKCGDYTLIDRERRRIQEENRRKIELSLKYEKISKIINQLKNTMEVTERYIEKNRNLINDQYTLKSIEELKVTFRNKLKRNNVVPSGINEIMLEDKKAEMELMELQELLNNINRDSSIIMQKKEEEKRLELNIQDVKSREINIGFSDIVQEKYDEYVVYSKQCNLEETKQLREFKNTEEIQEEINRLEEKHNKEAEEKYIEQSINEIMEELGYEIITSDTLNELNENEDEYIKRKAIYSFEDETGIEVFSSESGTLMMEVVNLSENNKEITEKDEELAFEKMQSFCKKYPIIIEKLREKGIELKNMECMPPDKSFTKKVVVENNHKNEMQKESSSIMKRRKNKNGFYKSM